MKYLIILLSILFFLACNDENSYKMDSGSKYLPSINLLQDGVISKYYIHQIDNKTKTTSTDIRYLKYQLVGDNKIIEEHFNAGYQKTLQKEIIINNSEWQILYEKVFLSNGDTLASPFDKNIMMDWNLQTTFSSLLKENKYYSSKQNKQQTAVIDSINDNRKIKTFYADANVLYIRTGDTSNTNIKLKKVWTEDLGMTFFQSTTDNTTYEWELVAIFTTEEFENRSNHGTYRVAYIDTSKTMDDSKKFKLCDNTSNIADYYNDNIAQFKGGKGSLKAYLNKHLNNDKLGQESGYLSFRFVVNCNGKAGWFVTEEADLAFNPKSFNNFTKEHLFTILKSVKEWKNLTIRNTPRDAYVYITFKLKNGKIIEILP